MSRDDSRAITSGMVTTIATAAMLIGATPVGAAMVVLLSVAAGCVMTLAIMDTNDYRRHKWREDAPIVTLDKEEWDK